MFGCTNTKDNQAQKTINIIENDNIDNAIQDTTDNNQQPEQQNTASKDNTLQFSESGFKSWPDNEFTQSLPMPDFLTDDVLSSTTKDSFAIVFYNPISLDQAKEYINTVKQFGYTVDASEQTNDQDVYTYVANNTQDKTVTISYYKDMFSITLDKIS